MTDQESSIFSILDKQSFKAILNICRKRSKFIVFRLDEEGLLIRWVDEYGMSGCFCDCLLCPDAFIKFGLESRSIVYGFGMEMLSNDLYNAFKKCKEEYIFTHKIGHMSLVIGESHMIPFNIVKITDTIKPYGETIFSSFGYNAGEKLYLIDEEYLRDYIEIWIKLLRFIKSAIIVPKGYMQLYDMDIHLSPMYKISCHK